MKKALVTGITGQDAFQLVELLLTKGYEVHGIKNHTALFKLGEEAIAHKASYLTYPCFHLHYLDLTDIVGFVNLIKEVQPVEIYHLGVTPSILATFKTPEHISETTAFATLRLLEAVHIAELTHKIRIYQTVVPTLNHYSNQQVSSCSITKLNSYQIMDLYRTSYGMHACNGTLFGRNLIHYNEPSLIEKIIRGSIKIALGLQGVLYLNSFNNQHDWGDGQDYAEGIWRTLQLNIPGNFIIATGIITTVREFVRLTFAELGIDIIFQGEGIREVGYIVACHDSRFILMPGQTVIALDPIYYQAHTVELPLAEASKVRRQLGWKPRHDLCTLVREMVERELQFLLRDTSLINTDQEVLL